VAFLLPLAYTTIGRGYFYISDLRKAQNYVLRAFEFFQDLGIQMLASNMHSVLAMIQLDLGDYQKAKSHAEKGLALAQKNTERQYEGILWTLLGRILGKKEPAEFDKAEEHIVQGIRILDELKLRPYLSIGYFRLGDLYNCMGRKGEALKYLNRAEEMVREMGMDYWLNRAREVLERL
jgi:tetratricopeptide (TPR) repeat protein